MENRQRPEGSDLEEASEWVGGRFKLGQSAAETARQINDVKGPGMWLEKRPCNDDDLKDFVEASSSQTVRDIAEGLEGSKTAVTDGLKRLEKIMSSHVVKCGFCMKTEDGQYNGLTATNSSALPKAGIAPEMTMVTVWWSADGVFFFFFSVCSASSRGPLF
ncbi:unnamed protein product [Heligmosomoides polygyrus]|uniref:Syntaxin-6_N domain-containing protein n=1 Tax=Heligmosomoides polygyrus TaxID=6339 RepID=A0A183F6H2_HELPZ|nr:unnamed protein product [Heligmosomoides polygyrus]